MWLGYGSGDGERGQTHDIYYADKTDRICPYTGCREGGEMSRETLRFLNDGL